jgi:hypothetical protein
MSGGARTVSVSLDLASRLIACIYLAAILKLFCVFVPLGRLRFSCGAFLLLKPKIKRLNLGGKKYYHPSEDK